MAANTLNVLYCLDRNTLYFILIMRYNNMLLFAYFSDTQIAPQTRLSHIHSHNTSCMFMSTSKLFLTIVTLTKKGGC